MHPMIKPALRRGWRDRATVQYGVAPAHAIQLGPVDTATGSFLDLLDGTRSVPQLAEAAQSLGLGAARVGPLLDRLLAAGVLDDSTADRSTAAHVGERLRPDLASLSVVYAAPGEALRRLAARRAARVEVRGGGRVGSVLAALLSAAGVGRVEARDGGCVSLADCAPGGVSQEWAGERRLSALRRVINKATPWARVPRPRCPAPGELWPEVDQAAAEAVGAASGDSPSPAVAAPVAPPGGGRRSPAPAVERPAPTVDRPAPTVDRSAAGPRPGGAQTAGPGADLVVFAPRDGLAAYAPDPEAARELMESGRAHLYTGVVEGTGFVGPLVRPGAGACAECMMLGRAEREPTWPLVVGQWRNARARGVPACDVALASVVAGAAAALVLRHVEGEATAGVGLRECYVLPELRKEAEPLPAWSECPCGAALRTEATGPQQWKRQG
ncbi:ThiF family adenylyltransferase [Streptomyces sp. OF8]|uniref:ThiF family adenylyltransferase n=2 Tax=Streptomyces alkaliterrae TaxID=2213162 RepID=A0A5P0YW30_9ACTN|nr:ThiF family adenylyltransferase [Streptomyces alkaliterrae]MQS03807.1 ThiF family adenylyltransferase [Streptomyces alkaliterrae]